MFFKINDRIINLKNVSNINVLRDKNRIVFNLNYNIQITAGHKNLKYISDYVYWDSINYEDLLRNLVYLNENEYFKNNYLNQIDGNGYININEISSVKYSDKKRRVIFNLSHPVTFIDFDGNEKITSEFVYVNCTEDQYSDYIKYINNELGV